MVSSDMRIPTRRSIRRRSASRVSARRPRPEQNASRNAASMRGGAMSTTDFERESPVEGERDRRAAEGVRDRSARAEPRGDVADGVRELGHVRRPSRRGAMGRAVERDDRAARLEERRRERGELASAAAPPVHEQHRGAAPEADAAQRLAPPVHVERESRAQSPPQSGEALAWRGGVMKTRCRDLRGERRGDRLEHAESGARAPVTYRTNGRAFCTREDISLSPLFLSLGKLSSRACIGHEPLERGHGALAGPRLAEQLLLEVQGEADPEELERELRGVEILPEVSDLLAAPDDALEGREPLALQLDEPIAGRAGPIVQLRGRGGEDATPRLPHALRPVEPALE